MNEMILRVCKQFKQLHFYAVALNFFQAQYAIALIAYTLPFYDEINVIKLCLVFKCLNGQCPEYLSNTLTRVSDISTRQSRHGSITLRCPKYSCKTEGGRTFAVTAVKEWNKLPINIRSSQNVKLFINNYVNYLKESYVGLDHFSIS